MFLPLRLSSMDVANRVVVSPMAQYSATDGIPDDWHLMHYGSRAAGGAGLLVTEMTCIAPDARITPGCTGLWNEAQRDAWQRIVDFVHRHSPAKIALQLGHAGRKGSTQLGWQEMDRPLPEGNWPLLSASALPYLPGMSQTPARNEWRRFRAAHLASSCDAARFGAAAGFDMLELHMAHGYLLASFLSPLTNRRSDEYGGAVENRLRYPLEVLRAVREAWPAIAAAVGSNFRAGLGARRHRVRRTSSPWRARSRTRRCGFAQRLDGPDGGGSTAGVRAHVANPIRGPDPQHRRHPDRWRWAISSRPDHVNTIVGAGRADLCAIARPHLADPAWTLHAAAGQHYSAQWWPEPYLSGKSQMERNLERAALMLGAV